jgi:outer membrane protein assembly factor BamB
MKRFLIILILTLPNCSFDNKTGIWKNIEQNDIVFEDTRFKDFKALSSETKTFNTVIKPKQNVKIVIDPVKIPIGWNEPYYQNSNNSDNFKYKDLNELIFKSRKLTKYKVKNHILFDGERILTTDIKGNIIIYSIQEKKVLIKYNFYKKKYKKIEKKLHFIVEGNIVYVADNLGYLYALNYDNNRILWAKNYKVPFRSNLKIMNNIIVAADQNNSLYFFNKSDGVIKKQIPTEEVSLKNNYINSMALNKDGLFYLNTYGSLYSVNKNNFRIKWFINLNKTVDLNPSNLFYSNPVVIYKKRIIVSTDPDLYIIDVDTGSTTRKISISSILKPIVSGNNIFLITKDNLLVCINLISGNIEYSLNISEEIGEFLETDSKPIIIKSLFLVNNNLFVFLNNSYLVKFNSKGKIYNINKLPEKIGTLPIFINESILYLNRSNKLSVIN